MATTAATPGQLDGELEKRLEPKPAGTPPQLTPWRPGQSGNPTGKARGAPQLSRLCRERTVEAIECLTEIMRDGAAPPTARVTAACAILDRGWGRPIARVDTVHTRLDLTAMSKEELIKIVDDARQRGEIPESLVPRALTGEQRVVDAQFYSQESIECNSGKGKDSDTESDATTPTTTGRSEE